MPAAAGILGLIVAVEALYLVGTFVILPSSNYFAAVFASVLVDQTNGVRQTESLGTLKTNPILEHAARLKVEDMVTKGYFSHNSPDGKTPWYWFEQAGYNYAAAGENLAVNFVDSQDVTTAWMQSPTHRANIMSGNYTEIGIAVMSGMYKGREAIFVVQEFGRPSVVAQETLINKSEVYEPIIVLPPSPPVTKPVSPTTIKKSVAAPKATITPVPARSTQTTTIVAGVETQKLPLSVSSISVPSELEPVLAAGNPESHSLLSPIMVAEASEASSIDTIVASPRKLTTTIYFIFATILALILSLTIFIKIRVQHPHLIVNGVLLIALSLSLVLLNSVIGFTGAI